MGLWEFIVGETKSWLEAVTSQTLSFKLLQYNQPQQKRLSEMNFLGEASCFPGIHLSPDSYFTVHIIMSIRSAGNQHGKACLEGFVWDTPFWHRFVSVTRIGTWDLSKRRSSSSTQKEAEYFSAVMSEQKCKDSCGSNPLHFLFITHFGSIKFLYLKRKF